MVALIKSFQHSRTGSWLLPLSHFNIPEPVTMVTLRHFNFQEVVTMVTLLEIFQHTRTGYPGYSHQSISTFQNWSPWLLYLYHFKILELVTMVTLVKIFQHSRTG